MTEVRKSRDREQLQMNFDPELGRTKQQFAEEVNINAIMSRYRNNAIIPETRSEPGHYGDFSNVAGYDQAMEQTNIANQAFSELTSDVREQFANDPANLLEFMSDPRNEEKARALGILPPLKVEPEGGPGAPEVPGQPGEEGVVVTPEGD